MDSNDMNADVYKDINDDSNNISDSKRQGKTQKCLKESYNKILKLNYFHF